MSRGGVPRSDWSIDQEELGRDLVSHIVSDLLCASLVCLPNVRNLLLYWFASASFSGPLLSVSVDFYMYVCMYVCPQL